MGFVDYEPNHKRVKTSKTVVWLALLSIGAIVVFVVPWRQFQGDRRLELSLKCSVEHVRPLVQAMRDYAQAHGGKLPRSVADLLRGGHLTSPGILVCPASGETMAPGSTPSEWASAIESGGNHCSYVYVGAGLTLDDSPDSILLYEATARHGMTLNGVHVGRLGGSVEVLPLKSLLSELSRPTSVQRPGGQPMGTQPVVPNEERKEGR